MSTLTMQTKKWTFQAGVIAVALGAWACGPGVDLAVKVVVVEPPPASIEAGQPLGLVAQVQTNQNQVVEAYEGDVTVRIVAGPHTDALGGSATVKAVKGVATFTDLTLTRVGTGYRLAVKPQTVPGSRDISDQVVGPVAVTPGPLAGITVIEQPRKGAPNGVIFPFPRVAVADAYGNVVSDENAEVTVALANNPTGATLSGTLTRETENGVVMFDDLRVNNLGTGYTLRFTTSAANATSSAFDVAIPRLVYTDPPADEGVIRVVRNAASTDGVAVLDVVAAQAFTGYSVGFTLPTQAGTVRAGAPLISNVGGLNPGSSPAAVGAALPLTGKMAGKLTAGISQKMAGTGAVTTDTAVSPGTVLFQLRLELAETPLFTDAFNGATMGLRFEAAVRNNKGEDVVSGQNFRFGRLAVE